MAADPDASHDARLAAACWRVEAAVEALTSRSGAVVATDPHLRAEGEVHVGVPALVHARGLARVLTELDAPLRTQPSAWMARS